MRIGLAAVALFAGMAIVVSPARPIDTTAAGRLYLWRIVSPHVREAPLVGQGPGAVTLRFPEWQRRAAREGVRDRRFAGLTDHVHNDYLEALVERGASRPGVAAGATRGPGGAGRRGCRDRCRRCTAGAIAAVAAGAACALVDFPLARPTELAWWWVAIALALQATPPTRACDRADRVTFARRLTTLPCGETRADVRLGGTQVQWEDTWGRDEAAARRARWWW